ncbi:MAG: type IV toxin-antitoxin system AbiEi family antitoxin domain-containing protein [Candidatus Sulfotelmatobacter sp.]
MRSRIDELLPFAEENEGFVTAAHARSLGIKDSVLARLTQRGKLQRVARGVYRIPYFPSDRLGQYREAILWARADSGPKKIALSHETALAVYGISDANPSRVQITVPKSARLRRRRPKWVEIHRADLRASDIVNREGLPVTTIEKAISQLLEETGRVGLARGALKDARKQGYISAEKASALTRRLNRNVHAKGTQEANVGKV